MLNNAVSRVERVFHAALKQPVAERRNYVARTCSGNPTLLHEVDTLIHSWESSRDLFNEPALELGLSLLSESRDSSLINRTIAGYRIISLLGKGGMGEVYLALDERLERRVALKFLSKELLSNRSAKDELLREARAIAKLDHPNIRQIFAIVESDDTEFIVMQFVEGKTLADLIRERAVRKNQVFDLARQIVSAIAEAHANAIIHRDIKPQNIILNAKGQPQVVDFGLATSINESTSRLTTGVPGTMRYMSPEQLQGNPIDFRSDVFSLGTLLYEMVSGRNPFARKNDCEVASAILNHEPKPWKMKNDCSGKLGAAIQRCLAKDPNDRYKSAVELLVDLES